jgi:hypothetical protein
MRIGLRLLFAVTAISPLILLQGRPDLAPGWLYENTAGVPTVIWLAILWFAMFVAAAWVPVVRSDER